MSTNYQRAYILFLALIFALIFTENIFGSFIYLNISEAVGSLIPYLKYIVFICMAALTIVLMAFRKIPLNSIDIAAAGYLLYLLLFNAISTANGIPLGSYFYLYIFPVFIYFSGKMYRNINPNRLFTVLVPTIYLTGIFGIVDLYIFKELFWKDILDYGTYISKAKGFEDTIVDGLPGNFYYSPYLLKIKRMISTLGDPLAYGYFCFISYCLIAHSDKIKNKKLILTFLVIVMLLTITRAAIMAVLITYAVKLFSKKGGIYIVLFVATIGLFSISQGLFDENNISDSSTIGHVNSILNIGEQLTVEHLLLGGLSESGFVYFEPGVPNILLNYGVAGFALFIIFIVTLYNRSLKTNLEIALIFAAGVFTLVVFSQSFLSTTSSWLAWFCAGWFISYNGQPRHGRLDSHHKYDQDLSSQ